MTRKCLSNSAVSADVLLSLAKSWVRLVNKDSFFLVKFLIRILKIMPHYQTWEEFSRAVEKLYLADPMKVRKRFIWSAVSIVSMFVTATSWSMVFFSLQVRVVLKYRHCDGNLCIKVTDNALVREMHHKYGYSGQLKMGSCAAIWG